MLASTVPSTIGRTETTPGICRIFWSSSSKFVIGPPLETMPRWPLMPMMRPTNSARNPFITDITMISVATPSAMPNSEKIAITETNPSCRRARR